MKMALEEDIAELDSVLGDLNDMMKDLNVRSVLEFFPTNNNDVSGFDCHNVYMMHSSTRISHIKHLLLILERWNFVITLSYLQWKHYVDAINATPKILEFVKSI